MLMRYLWGLAVGHTYAHQKKHFVREGDSESGSEQEEGDDQGVYDEGCAHDRDEGRAQDQGVCDDESGQYRSDSDSVSDSTDDLDLSDYDMEY